MFVSSKKNRGKSEFSAGFALIQILVASVIIAVVALGVATTLFSGFRGVANNRNVNAADDIADRFTALLESESFCSAQFKGIAVPASLPAIVKSNFNLKKLSASGDLTSDAIFEENQYAQGLVKISKTELSIDYFIGVNKYVGSLIITMNADTGKLTTLSRAINLILRTDGSGNIKTCSRVNAHSVDSFEPGDFSVTCYDFLAKGWSSRDDCLKDGRWHLVYSIDNNGDTLIGSSGEFLSYIRAGAVAKVGVKEDSVDKYELCQVINRNLSKQDELSCITSTRTNENKWIGSTRRVRGIDGVVYMNDGNSYTRTETKKNATNWYIKF